MIYIIGFFVMFLVFVGFSIAAWEKIYRLRRKHRLEREADDRERRRLLAEDYSRATAELKEQMSFESYLQNLPLVGGQRTIKEKVN